MLFQLNGLRKYFLMFSKTVKHNYPHAVGPVHCADVMIIYSLLSLTHTHTHTHTHNLREVWQEFQMCS